MIFLPIHSFTDACAHLHMHASMQKNVFRGFHWTMLDQGTLLEQ